MKSLFAPRCLFVFAIALASGLGVSLSCAEKPQAGTPQPVPFGAPTELTATLADPINIDLKWKDNASNEAGYFVEYSPDANDEFLLIDVLPPNSTTYRHPDLLAETRFVFRVRPFFGLASNVAEIATGKEAPQHELPVDVPALSQKDAAANARKKSLKSNSTQAKAAPTALTAKLIPPAGVQLQWKDNAADADEYMLEIRPEDGEFRASAFLEAGSTSLVTYGFPYESKFFFRVRAILHGEPSNLAEQTTGADPAERIAAADAPADKPAAENVR